jgi:hypothetical protein
MASGTREAPEKMTQSRDLPNPWPWGWLARATSWQWGGLLATPKFGWGGSPATPSRSGVAHEPPHGWSNLDTRRGSIDPPIESLLSQLDLVLFADLVLLWVGVAKVVTLGGRLWVKGGGTGWLLFHFDGCTFFLIFFC